MQVVLVSIRYLVVQILLIFKLILLIIFYIQMLIIKNYPSLNSSIYTAYNENESLNSPGKTKFNHSSN